ncbi:hypothetical protein ACVIN2_002912 [Bradyrhizobium sp. USDA 3650]
MGPKKHRRTGSNDLFRAPLDQIINMKHELVQLAGKIDWDWIDGEVAPLYSENGRPGIETRFMIGLLLLKHTYGLSDEGVCERWVHDLYLQFFTGEEVFQHAFPHERSDLSHWRKRLGDKLELLLAESLRVAHEAGALRSQDLKRVTVDTTVQPKAITLPTKTAAAWCCCTKNVISQPTMAGCFTGLVRHASTQGRRAAPRAASHSWCMYRLIMAIRPDALPTNPAALSEMVPALDAENEKLRVAMQTFKEMILGSARSGLRCSWPSS